MKPRNTMCRGCPFRYNATETFESRKDFANTVAEHGTFWCHEGDGDEDGDCVGSAYWAKKHPGRPVPNCSFKSYPEFILHHMKLLEEKGRP